MGQSAEAKWVTRYDRVFRLIQNRFADQIKTPVEIRLWGNHSYRFGKGEPAIKVLVKDRDGLVALSRLDELKICEAYMAGSLDVMGDMLGFVSLRRVLSDRQTIASHYDFGNEFYLTFMDPTRCYSQAVFERDDEMLEIAQRRKLDFAIDSCQIKPVPDCSG